ncbi:hypothetical protein ACU686_41795 [Yinghuangia aomiensis]
MLTCRHAINTPTGIEIVDLDQRGRGREIQRESEGVLARVQAGPRQPDGTRQLFMMRLDPESGHSGRVVTVEAPAEPGGLPRFREVVAGQAGDILRDMVIVDRGPGRPPAVALSVRRNGGEVRIDLVSLRETADGAATTDRRWTVPLPDAQPITAADGSTQITGNYGLVTGLSATGGGHGVLEIEYTSRESVPHRLYRLSAVEPGAAAVQAAGPTNEQARDAGIPAVDVALHMAPGERDHSTPVFVLRRAGAEPGPAHEPPAKVPTIVWPYPSTSSAVRQAPSTPSPPPSWTRASPWSSRPSTRQRRAQLPGATRLTGRSTPLRGRRREGDARPPRHHARIRGQGRAHRLLPVGRRHDRAGRTPPHGATGSTAWCSTARS